jgi:hypothetical protein
MVSIPSINVFTLALLTFVALCTFAFCKEVFAANGKENAMDTNDNTTGIMNKLAKAVTETTGAIGHNVGAGAVASCKTLIRH